MEYIEELKKRILTAEYFAKCGVTILDPITFFIEEMETDSVNICVVATDNKNICDIKTDSVNTSDTATDNINTRDIKTANKNIRKTKKDNISQCDLTYDNASKLCLGKDTNKQREEFNTKHTGNTAERDREFLKFANEKAKINCFEKASKQMEIGEGTIIYPLVTIKGICKIGRNVILQSGTILDNATIGDDTTIENSKIENSSIKSKVKIDDCKIVNSSIDDGAVIENSKICECEIASDTIIESSKIVNSVIGSHATVGCFAYIRNNTKVGDYSRIGDFVEIKNSILGRGTKAAHLAYIGDATIGDMCNVGCGVVFANYDGQAKTRTIVGDNVFIGSNTNLVAPITIGNGCYIAAGSTITVDLGEKDFCIARAREYIKKGGAIGRYGKK